MTDRTRPAGSGAVLGWMLLSAVAPGAAHLRAGWRRTGLALLTGYALLLLGVLWLVLTADGDLFGALLTSGARMTAVTVGAALLGLGWFALIIHSFLVLRPGRLPQRGQFLTGMAAGLLSVAVVLPFGLVTQAVWVGNRTIDSVFNRSTEPLAGERKPVNPWASRTRVNILLLGGDADDNRTGVRTDSMNVASIDVKTGNTVLLSLPRNLEDVRFPPGSPMARRFPDGFRLPRDGAGGRSDLLNSVWEYADAHPELFGGRKGQGAQVLMDTIGYTLGLKIDWYALVNMWGFARLIDAIGGITITVEQDVVFGKYNEGLVKAGTRKLKGADAMWYARSRTYSDDFTRMRRQRCVMGALLQQADPATVLTRFNGIALAARELVRTDIPRDMLQHLVPLALKVKNAKVTSVQFVPPLINTGYPDWTKIRAVTAKAIKDSVTPKPSVASAAPSPKTSATSTATPKPSDAASPKGITDGCGGL
ncbi:LCP family protein [Nonomuraea africana]|uniref:LCP family protein required for cell wall assembly n=1 Tax=Nonomuraea africana TaxID=46171 RepID=A0ABR9K9B7_9ACTN|nr:LCP family protein [Nonomuraea africana]MBE1558607.1 LCP family protein required for cell wall assembly [Nonomuraea africana]